MEAPEDATKLMLANLQNVFSCVQTQDGVLASVGKIYKRVDELATMAMDPHQDRCRSSPIRQRVSGVVRHCG
jgi:flagellin-like hook-associated protein FlgL